METLILTEGGRGIGLGHITRCISLCQALEEKGITPEFLINGDDAIFSLFKGRNYKRLNWLEDRNRLYNYMRDIDMAIVDSYLADIGIYEFISKAAKIPVFMDDNKRLDYPKSIVVNGSSSAEEFDYPKKNGVLYLIGTKYIPIRRVFWDVPEKDIKENVGSVMITTGGCDTSNIAPQILKILIEDFPAVTKNIVIGRGSDNIGEINEMADRNTRLASDLDADSMLKIMLESDIAISTGGQTLYELARVGVPTIGICVAENQSGNVKGMQEAGFIQGIQYFNNAHLLSEVRKKLHILMPKKRRQEISYIGRKIVDGRGAIRVIKEAVSL